MKQLATLSALAVILSVVAAADAQAWTRNRTVTGAYGTSTVAASGSCADRSCSRQITRTGPNGLSASREGSLSCANGTCTGSRTTTGRHGRTWSSQSSFTH